jgi:uncharacterized protein YkwD
MVNARPSLTRTRTPALALALGALAACSGSSAAVDGTGSPDTMGPDDGAVAQTSSDDATTAPGSTTSDASTARSDASPMSAGDAGPATPANLEAGTVLDLDGGTCPAPAGLDANATAALQLVNTTRAAMGSPCATMVPALNTSAADHCAYYAANQATASCIADPHTEVQGCTDYVGAQFSTRETAAGYKGQPSFETMAFSDNGASAVQQWIDSVWHRTPVLSPWARDIGYGSATKCDTMDFGIGAAAPKSLVVPYPYDHQTGVPTSFNGKYEGPAPPMPPAGWPSGYPVHVYARGATFTTHEFSVDGGPQLDHQWITAQTNSLAQDTVILYGNAPLKAATTYRVHVAGTATGGAPLDVNVTFTTK